MIWETDGINPDWLLKSIEKLASKVGSGSTPRGGRRSYPDQGTPFIRSQNVHFDGFTTEGLAFLTDEQARQLDGVTVQANDVLLNITGASIGRVCVAPSAMAGARVNQHVCIIRPVGVKPAFLAKYLASPQVQDAIFMGNYGVTREALTKSQILELPVPVPDDDEQDRLVDLIDRATAHRVRAEAHHSEAERAIKRVQQAALAAACSGRLTADWRAEHGEDATSLVHDLEMRAGMKRKATASPQEELVDSFPDGWKIVTLSLLIERIEAGKSFTALGRPATADEWGVIKVSAMSWGRFREDENKAVPEGRVINPDYEIKPGDLLLSRANTEDLVGATVLVGESRPHLLLSDKSLRLVPYEGISAAWLNYALRAPLVRSQFSAQATGTSDSMRNLSQTKILDTTLLLPPTMEQREIARRLSELLSVTDTLLPQLSTAEKAVDRISQAILAKAFQGGLVQVEDVA